MSTHIQCPIKAVGEPINCCGDPSHCGGCAVLGRSASMMSPSELQNAARSTFPGRAPLLGPGEIRLPPGQIVEIDDREFRRIGPLERLIAGPQGDPTLKGDFYSFLGCIACGTGLALVLVAIVLAGRVLLGGAQ